ncbi:Transcriptional regulator, LysR family [hydrothermal vent metagenome]|uniref:Transcriptional regulator, LysR family n=1 Tax=hydrothermal vent metagenome TaxID=652676 RepID=A0A3B0RH82_9ZZZZ
MQAFAEVGQTGSFAEAARRLGLARSVVSKRVKDLEAYLQTQLLVRTTRKVRLTDNGYGYLEYVRKFLDELEEVELALRQHRENPVGTIKLSAPLSFGMQYLGEALSSYLEKYPDVTINTYLSDRQVSLIDEGYDLSIRMGPLKSSSLIAKKLVNCRRVVCASPAYFEKYEKPETPNALKGHNCLGYLNLAEGKAWPFLIDGKRTWQAVSGRFAVDNGDLLHQAALEGCGITLLPSFIVGNSIRDGKLQPVLQAYEETDFNVYAIYQHTRHLSTKVRTLIDHLCLCFGKETL